MITPDERWSHLLSSDRLRNTPEVLNDRGSFDRDFDRIVHSSNFRRLKDKTQVFPFSKNDFVRTRLTHSLEVACIGRTLGRRVWEEVLEIPREKDIAAIVAAACLAHDIGNPPFGHSGEYAIQAWARKHVRAEYDDSEADTKSCDEVFRVNTAQERQDLHDFDGNAQSLRVVARIQARRRIGGMQLTFATLGAMMKYPCGSLRNINCPDQKKCGYFADDERFIIATFERLGLESRTSGVFRRHPLAYLVEAADDISNAVVDLEDTVDQKLISPTEAINLLKPIAESGGFYKTQKYADEDELERLRAYATNALVSQCVDVFEKNKEAIRDGHFDTDLVAATRVSHHFNSIRKAIKNKAFSHPRVLEVEAAGFRVINGLLNSFVPALVHKDRSREEQKLFSLFPLGYLRLPGDGEILDDQFGDESDRRESAVSKLSTYQRILAVTDYVSGMTDGFAVDLYQKLSGIRLPT